MTNKNLSDNLFERKILKNIEEINIYFEKTILELESALRVYVDGLECCKENRFEILSKLYNTIIHINLLLLDNKTTAKNLINAKTLWQKLYYIRIFYTIAYEALDDIPQITGKDFRTLLSTLSNGEKYLQELKNLSKPLQEFKIKNNDFLKKVRNITFAHRDHNSELQISLIKLLNWGDAIDLMLSFDPIIRGYGQFMQSILSDLTNKSDSRNEFLYK